MAARNGRTCDESGLGALLALPIILAAGASTAAAAPCPAQVGVVEWRVSDKSDEQVANGDSTVGLPASLPTTHKIELSASASPPASQNTSIGDTQVSLPAGLAFTRDPPSTVFTALAAGPVPVTATWTETTRNTFPPDVVCTGSAVGTLNFVAASRPRVTVLAKAEPTSRPSLQIVIRATRRAFGDARDIVVRGKGIRAARPATGLLRTLFTLPFSDNSRANTNSAERAIPLGAISAPAVAGRRAWRSSWASSPATATSSGTSSAAAAAPSR